MPIQITNENRVTLEGYLDANRDLQFRYGTQELSANDDTVVVFYDGEVDFALTPPPGGSVRATHDEGRETVTWQTQGGGIGHSFTTTSDPVDVQTESPPAPPKHIFVQVKPTGGLPDT